jgi:hypothetical protein
VSERIKSTVTIRFENGESFDALIAEGGGDGPLLICPGPGNDDCNHIDWSMYGKCGVKLCMLVKDSNGDEVECKATFNVPPERQEDPPDEEGD